MSTKDGGPERRTGQVWHDGELVAEKRQPSDRLLMWLLARLDPKRFAAPWELRGDRGADPQAEARAGRARAHRAHCRDTSSAATSM